MVAERPALQRYVGRKLTVIAWLWARTVKSPNSAFAQVDVPLASTFMLSTKKGKEAYVEPVVEDGGYRFTVKDGAPEPGVSKAGVTETGASEAGDTEAGIRRNDAPESGVPEDGVPGNAGVPPLSSSFPRKRESMRPENGVSREDTGVPPAQGTKLGRGANFRCLMSDAPIPGDYIKCARSTSMGRSAPRRRPARPRIDPDGCRSETEHPKCTRLCVCRSAACRVATRQAIR